MNKKNNSATCTGDKEKMVDKEKIGGKKEIERLDGAWSNYCGKFKSFDEGITSIGVLLGILGGGLFLVLSG
ncbi:hypothetical protein LCGC14_3119420, partial [marine sediment metagenome]